MCTIRDHLPKPANSVAYARLNSLSCAYPVQVVSSACFPMPSTPAVTAPPDDLHHVCRSPTMLFPYTPQPLRCIVHTACRSSTILVSQYPSTPVVHVQGDMHRAYCVQVIDDSCSSIPINPLDPCSSKQFASCILCAGHQRFLFLCTHQPLWSMFLQVIWIMHTVCRSSTILIPPYPVIHVPPSDMDHAYCVQVIDNSHSPIPCGPRSSK